MPEWFARRCWPRRWEAPQDCLSEPRTRKSAGFSMAEPMIVVGILLILFAVAIPSLQTSLQYYRTVSDARSIAAQLALARMRAASDFTWARLNFNLAANTYQLEVWNKAAAAYQVEGPTLHLSQSVTFGYGNVIVPAGGQTTIAQSPQIVFNSRGLSVDGSGNPIGTAAIYIGNNQGFFCAITASIAGQPAIWEYGGATWKRL